MLSQGQGKMGATTLIRGCRLVSYQLNNSVTLRTWKVFELTCRSLLPRPIPRGEHGDQLSFLLSRRGSLSITWLEFTICFWRMCFSSTALSNSIFSSVVSQSKHSSQKLCVPCFALLFNKFHHTHTSHTDSTSSNTYILTQSCIFYCRLSSFLSTSPLRRRFWTADR